MCFGISSVRGSRDSSAKKTRINDENWYIPYNGPYEEPPHVTTKRDKRDSWGDIIPFGVTIDNLEPIKAEDILEKRKPYEPRDIKYGAQGPRIRRRSTISSVVSSTDYMSLDGVSGGVGESPVPRGRAQKDQSRISFGSIFTFRNRMRMGSPARSVVDEKEERLDIIDVGPAAFSTSNKETERATKPSKNSYLTDKKTFERHQRPAAAGSRQYLTLAHPYANQSHDRGLKYEQLHSPSSDTNTAVVASGIGLMSPGVGGVGLGAGIDGKKIKSSRSTPNFRNAQINDDGPSNAFHQPVPPLPSDANLPPPRPKDVVLSAETWCDALLFPRPRLKIQNAGPSEESFIGGPGPSGPIVSPPPSPLGSERDIEIHSNDSHLQSRLRGTVQKQMDSGIPSRVLAHSKGLDVQTRSGKDTSGAVRRGKAKAVPSDKNDMQYVFPPTPVPNLSEVLSEGRHLDKERQAWQALAVNSLGNKRSRSLSRTRSKSQTRRGKSAIRRNPSLEHLPTQASLGNQPTSMNPAVRARLDSAGVNGAPSTSRTHPRSNSLSTPPRVNKLSKSMTHTKNNSLGKLSVHSGLLNVSKLCGALGVDLDPVERAPNGGSAAKVRTAQDLEGALKEPGTRFIRLADPAHIPLDKGLPISQSLAPVPTHSQRNNPSPHLSDSNLSVISQSMVGIAISTPPEEEEGVASTFVPAGPFAVSASYVPSHPYAQGGLSFSVPTSSAMDSRGLSDSKVPPVAELLARQKNVPHPYASTSRNTAQDQPSSRQVITLPNRDSYLDANGLIGQYRSEDRHPDPTRMWAQLSPDIVREILPEDLRHSPFEPDIKGSDKLERSMGLASHRINGERMKSIHDTAGVAEALLSTTRYGLDGNRVEQERNGEDRMVKQFDRSEKMQAKRPDRSAALNDSRKPSHSSSSHTIASSQLHPDQESPSPLDHLDTTSPVPPSPSPVFPLLRSPTEPDSFYQASMSDFRSPASGDDRANVLSWDSTVRNRSSLTSLARQLGEEYESLASAIASRAGSTYFHRTRSLGSQPRQSGTPALLTEGNLQFVLEEKALAESPERISNVHESVHTFEAVNLPEDVDSLQTSSITDGNGEDDDPTGLLRLGVVESLSTPTAVDAEHRLSFNGETIFDFEDQDPTLTKNPNLSSQPNTDPDLSDNAVVRRSDLPHETTQATRSSYMTTSDVSRMSNLSDFPLPPKSAYSQHEASLHMPTTPLHVSSFDGEREADDGLPQPNASFMEGESSGSSGGVSLHQGISAGEQVEFGVNQSAAELANSLSSPELL